MNEYADLVKDYKDCINYLCNIDKYNYETLCRWALIKYNDWISKDERYIFSSTGGTVPPKDAKEKAKNILTNFKTTLERIAFLNNIQL